MTEGWHGEPSRTWGKRRTWKHGSERKESVAMCKVLRGSSEPSWLGKTGAACVK